MSPTKSNILQLTNILNSNLNEFLIVNQLIQKLKQSSSSPSFITPEQIILEKK